MADGMWLDNASFSQILAWHSSMILSQVSAMMAEREPPLAREGVIVGGSFDPKDGTVQVILGDTYAIIGDDNIIPDSGVAVARIPLLTTQLGDQYGPVGNERALLIPSQSGYHALIHHDEDDAQTALPAGERWISHRDASGTIDAFIKQTNDGTPGDGLGGLYALAGSLLSILTAGGSALTMDDATNTVTLQAGSPTLDGAIRDELAPPIPTFLNIKTAAGFETTFNDALKQIKTTTAAGFHTLYDDAGRAISHITPGGLQTISSDVTSEISHLAPNVGLGALVGSMDATHAALNQSHLTAFESNMFSKRLDDLVKFATAMIAAGVPNASAVIGELATLLHIPVPNGSAVVKLVS